MAMWLSIHVDGGAAANLICTASSSRCKAISIDRLSLFSLTTLLASALIVASLPVLAGAATMLLLASFSSIRVHGHQLDPLQLCNAPLSSLAHRPQQASLSTCSS